MWTPAECVLLAVMLINVCKVNLYFSESARTIRLAGLFIHLFGVPLQYLLNELFFCFMSYAITLLCYLSFQLFLFGMFALLSVVKSDDVYFLIPFFSRSPVQLGVPS